MGAHQSTPRAARVYHGAGPGGADAERRQGRGRAADGSGGICTTGRRRAAVRQAGFASLVIAPARRTAKELAEAIRPLLTKGVGTATPLGDSRLLLISDFSPRLNEVQGLLARLEAPVSPMLVEEIAIANVSPTALAATVMQVALKRDAMAGERLPGEVIVSPSGAGVVLIAPEAQAAAWRELIARFDQRETIEMRNYAPRVFPARDVARLVEEVGKGPPSVKPDDRWRLVVDDLTGTLMVSATPSQHAQVAALMERLDAAQGGPLPMRSFPIRNRPVGEMISTLSRLIEAGVLESSGAEASRDAVRTGGEQISIRDLGTGATRPAGSTQSASLLPGAGVSPQTATRSSAGGARLARRSASPPTRRPTRSSPWRTAATQPAGVAPPDARRAPAAGDAGGGPGEHDRHRR